MNLLRDDTEVRRAQQRVAKAKEQWTAAARASLARETGAAEKANAALVELKEAQAHLRSLVR